MRRAPGLRLSAVAAALAAAAVAGCGSASETGTDANQTPAAPTGAPQPSGPDLSTGATPATPTASSALTGVATGKLGSRARIATYREDGKTEVEVELHSAASGQTWNLGSAKQARF